MLNNIIEFYMVFKLRNNICFKQFGRLKLYRLGYSRKLNKTEVNIKRNKEGVNKI
jgi:hypothetical protein